jgi:hypothetical protein
MIATYNNLIYALGYLLFFGLLWQSKKLCGLRLFDQEGFVSNRGMLMVLHGGSIILLGLSPLFITQQVSTAILRPFNPLEISILINLLVVVMAFFISLHISRKKSGEIHSALFEK